MRLVDRIHRETAAFHADVDHEAFQTDCTAADYRRYLLRKFAFVAPVERSIKTTPDLALYLDLRRFNKAELLRNDLLALRLEPAQLNSLAQCPVPLFGTAEEALGWAYCLERSTLAHNIVFMHFAAVLPGEVAFSSSYLKCYFGSLGQMWRGFSEALDVVARNGDEGAHRVIGAAKTAFRVYRAWQNVEARVLLPVQEELGGS